MTTYEAKVHKKGELKKERKCFVGLDSKLNLSSDIFLIDFLDVCTQLSNGPFVAWCWREKCHLFFRIESSSISALRRREKTCQIITTDKVARFHAGYSDSSGWNIDIEKTKVNIGVIVWMSKAIIDM